MRLHVCVCVRATEFAHSVPEEPGPSRWAWKHGDAV